MTEGLIDRLLFLKCALLSFLIHEVRSDCGRAGPD